MESSGSREGGSRRGTRFTVLDSWRGVCAILVALHHLPALSHLYQADLVRHAWLLVDFFFVLSGFVLTHAYDGRIGSAQQALAFLIRRLGRVWPLHLAVLAGFVGIEIVKLVLAFGGFNFGQAPFTGTNSLAALPGNAFLLHAFGIHDSLTWNGPSWSISAEIAAYLAFAAIALAVPSGPLPAALLALLGAATVIALSPEAMDTTYQLGAFRCFYDFFIGALAYRVWRRWQSRSLPLAWAMETAAMLLAGLFIVSTGPTSASFAAPLVFAPCVVIFAFEAGPVSRLLRHPLLASVGAASYAIYMVHALVILGLTLLLRVAQAATGQVLFSMGASEAGGREVIAVGGLWTMDALSLGYVALVILLGIFCRQFVERPGITASIHLADMVLNRRPAASLAR